MLLFRQKGHPDQPRDDRGRYTYSTPSATPSKDLYALAKKMRLNLPSYPTRYEIEQALERAASSTRPVVQKKYVSQAQRNLFEACRADPGFSDKCPPSDVTEEYHEASRGQMKDKDLPERAEEKDKKKKTKKFMRL